MAGLLSWLVVVFGPLALDHGWRLALWSALGLDSNMGWKQGLGWTSGTREGFRRELGS